jgi:hypothetical protein
MRSECERMKRFGTAIWVAGIILLFGCGRQQSRPTPVATESDSQTQFRWLDSGRDSALWNRVQTAFAQELEPDDPRQVPEHYLPTQYKYVQKVGVVRTAALVILGYKETKESPGYDYFNAYSYDLRDGSKRPISFELPRPANVWPRSDVLWMFNVIKFAQFEQSAAPDVVFTYDGCTECEADHFLASFKYDSNKGWTARQWDNDKSLLLMYDPEPDENALSSDYLFKIKDWNGDGFDEVAVRRRKVTQDIRRKQVVDDSTMLYKAENGTLIGHYVYSNERVAINAELCRDSTLGFCRQQK